MADDIKLTREQELELRVSSLETQLAIQTERANSYQNVLSDIRESNRVFFIRNAATTIYAGTSTRAGIEGSWEQAKLLWDGRPVDC